MAMAIMGCGDAASTCQTLKIVEADFSSVDACHAAAPGVLRRLADLDYPVVTIECDTRTSLAVKAKAERVG